MLVNVPRLVTAYYAEHPDPAVAAERVAFGTSGHRGSAFERTFNEAHILAITQAICSYRQAHGIDGPLFMGMDTHALSEPAFVSALEVLAANGVEVMIDRDRGYTPTPVISHAILRYNRGRRSGLADGIVVTPSHNPPEDGGFKYNPPTGGPADTEVTGWIEQTANALLADDLRGVRRVPDERARRAATTHPPRLHHAVRRRSRERRRHGGDPQRRRANRRGSARRRRRALLGADHRAAWHRPHRREQRDRSDVPIHDRGLGWQDSDGLLIAVCDGASRRDARSFRRRLRQRRRSRSPRHRHAERRD